MIHAFNFEWANENLFHGLFQRTQGYFDGSELSSLGNPASARERELLEKVGADLPEDILEGSYRLPVGDRSGRDRDNLRRAGELMAQAGWIPENGVLTHEDTGQPFAFELLVLTREQERIGLHYKRLLGAIGVSVSLRQVDSSQFQRRLLSYDFDMVPVSWDNSLSPGNEQVFYWGSFGRTAEGTRNYMGADDPAIDAVIDAMLEAERPGRFRRRGAGAGQAAHRRALHRAALSRAGPVAGPLEPHRAARRDVALRLRPRHGLAHGRVGSFSLAGRTAPMIGP
jgi:peptide/nickel transport system substrate-binding protein